MSTVVVGLIVGAAGWGAEDRSCCEGEVPPDAEASAAGEARGTSFGPAGVATVAVWLIVGAAGWGAVATAIRSDGRSLSVAAAMAAEADEETGFIPAGVWMVVVFDIVGAAALGALDTAAAAGAGFTCAAEDVVETCLGPAGVWTVVVFVLDVDVLLLPTLPPFLNFCTLPPVHIRRASCKGRHAGHTQVSRAYCPFCPP